MIEKAPEPSGVPVALTTASERSDCVPIQTRSGQSAASPPKLVSAPENVAEPPRIPDTVGAPVKTGASLRITWSSSLVESAGSPKTSGPRSAGYASKPLVLNRSPVTRSKRRGTPFETTGTKSRSSSPFFQIL